MKQEKKDGGSTIFFDVEREEIGRVKLANGIDLVVSLVNDEHLDMRLWVDRYPYKGLRFYLPEGVYEELKKLIDRVDKVYQGKPEPALTVSEGVGEHQPISFSGGERKVTCKI